VLGRTGLRAGDPLDEGERARLLDADLSWRAREAALDLLTLRARSRRELEQRLRRKGFSPGVVNPCLDELAAKGIVDDQAFARSFVRDRLRLRPRGKGLLERELRGKGVDGETGARAVEEVFGSEEVHEDVLAREAALGWLRRQAPEARRALALHGRAPERERARRRLHGFLARRGFRGEAALAGVQAAEEEARASTP